MGNNVGKAQEMYPSVTNSFIGVSPRDGHGIILCLDEVFVAHFFVFNFDGCIFNSGDIGKISINRELLNFFHINCHIMIILVVLF